MRTSSLAETPQVAIFSLLPITSYRTTMFQNVPEIVCKGTPREIGLTHGSEAKQRIVTSINNYAKLYEECAQITWSEARDRARKFIPAIKEHAQHLFEEMEGIAEGAGIDFLDIVALNVRSEIALTNYTDGCTSIAKISKDRSSVFLAQNWDWLGEAGEATVFLDIRPKGKPRIQIFAEAGIVGKFGMNAAGVAVCMNAIRSGSLNVGMMPVHIAIRRVLECASYGEAKVLLDSRGVASCVNFMIVDKDGSGATVECSPKGNTIIEPVDGTVCHTNHLYAPGLPQGLKDHPSKNSFSRLERVKELSAGVGGSFEGIRSWLSDEQGSPTSISRSLVPGAVGMERMVTLATIIMDIKAKQAQVSLGRPSLSPPIKTLSFV